MNEARIKPLDPPYSTPIAAALDRIMPAGVPPLVLFRTVANNERVFLRLMASGLLDRGSLGMRERELVIDRTCFLCGSEYEWGVHVAFFGTRVGLTETEVRELQSNDPSRAVFSEREHLLLELCDQLHTRATIGDALWTKLSATYTPEQLIELVVLAGYYHTISFVTNALRLPLEPFASRFSAPRPSP